MWQQLTLTALSPQQWGKGSYLHRLIGSFKNWRKGSWLLQWAEPLGLLLIAVIFALAPFVSTTLTGFLLVACAAFWILLTLSDDQNVGITPIHLLVLLYWWVATLSVGFSPVKMKALVGWGELTLFIFFFALMARVLRSPPLRSCILFVYQLTALVVSVEGVRQAFFGAPPLATWVDADAAANSADRVYSYLNNPNLLAAYILPALILSIVSLFAWKNWGAKALAITMFVVNAYCMYRTSCRGAWVGLVAAGFVLLVLLVLWLKQYLPKFWQRWALPIVLGGSAAVLVAGVVVVDPLRDRVLTIFAGREDSSNNFRINVWAAVEEMIRDRPLLGIGPGHDAFNAVYPKYQRTGYTALSAYSVFLEIIVEMGFVGITCFLWLVLVTLNQGWIQLQRFRRHGDAEGFWLMGAIASIVGLLTHGLVDTLWFRPQINTIWWLMLAVIASYYIDPSTKSRSLFSKGD
jgi:putative inorganic carbon (hco3(-)) transporter